MINDEYVNISFYNVDVVFSNNTGATIRNRLKFYFCTKKKERKKEEIEFPKC